MDFQVSARKWRPQKFSELIGQEHIVRTLKNAIELDRIAHAYLFSGTRGVGKTTTARLLAKALNCEQGPTPEPCDACTFCNEIRDGSSLDVLEIDGASNNGVAEVRELIENVQYSTSSARFKVYIIDEVHMLSKSAFNALLKTLEEPPAQVIFIFATTELIKIPETILSRCQNFEFKPLTQRQIQAQLDIICKQDAIEIDTQSLEEIATNGAGSMRDAQSLLDQVIAFCGKKVDTGAVESVLGIVGQGVLEQFVDHVLAQDNAGLLALVQEVAESGKDLNYFCRDLCEYVRNLMFVKVSNNPESVIGSRTCNIDTLKRQVGSIDADQLQQMFAVLSKSEMDMKRASLPRMVFEMAVLRLTDIRPYGHIDDLIEKINQIETSPAARSSGVSTPPPSETGNGPLAMELPTAQAQVSGNGSHEQPAKVAVSSPPAAGSGGSEWEKIRAQATTLRRPLGTFLENCLMVALTPETLHLTFTDPYTKGLVEKEENLDVLKEAVKTVCNYHGIRVQLDLRSPEEVKQSAAAVPPAEKKSSKPKPDHKPSRSEEEILRDALDIFGGMVIR